MRIINKLLEENKSDWHKRFKYALWADRISTKRAIGMSLFQLVYGVEVVFPTSLRVPTIKLLQEQEDEPNHMQRRINQIIELNEMWHKAYDKVKTHPKNIKNTFDRKVKEEQFHINDLVLKWDAPREDKHGKFDNMWVCLYIIAAYRAENSFILQHQDGSQLKGGPVNGRFLKHYFS